ncbi:hypothetical protein PM082_017239 [Marasmius tenuissimus]|nr:hypothetical protein PM082_017239 [Marasmius tenuissimus]
MRSSIMPTAAVVPLSLRDTIEMRTDLGIYRIDASMVTRIGKQKDPSRRACRSLLDTRICQQRAIHCHDRLLSETEVLSVAATNDIAIPGIDSQAGSNSGHGISQFPQFRH